MGSVRTNVQLAKSRLHHIQGHARKLHMERNH